MLNYLGATNINVNPNCAPGNYYLVNNYNPGYFGNGSNAFTDPNPNNYVYTIPPSSVPTIGDILNTAGITWAYYGDQWNAYLNDPYQLGYNNGTDEYCNICNFEQYATSIMTGPSLAASLKDTTDLYTAIKDGNLPAVSFVKPSGFVDGHPASSKLILFEGFVKNIVEEVKANKKLWESTAILITFDEGGGYWDSGYVQPIDFFGDGTRIPMIRFRHSAKAARFRIATRIMPRWRNSSKQTGALADHHAEPDNLPNPVAGRIPMFRPILPPSAI